MTHPALRVIRIPGWPDPSDKTDGVTGPPAV